MALNSTTSLVRLTSTEYGVGIGYLPVFVNPAHVAYVKPRSHRGSHDGPDFVEGSLIYVGSPASPLPVRESVDEVLALLAGHDYDRELKLDLTCEAARADIG